jgi:NadR type nicotinamide-nucleotide adenylyltransferase
MLKKILITGPESTGKSTLAADLALYFSTRFVPEFARKYLSNLHRNYVYDDLKTMALQQILQEDLIAQSANKFLFVDTDPTVFDIWSTEKFGKTDPWILKEMETRIYDLILIPDIDLAWKPDVQRENPDDRNRLMQLYEESFNRRNLEYFKVSGLGEDRFNNAVQIILKQFN